MDAHSCTLMTVSEAADTLAVSGDTIRRYISDGRLASVRLGDSPHAPVRVASSDLARFLRRGSTTCTLSITAVMAGARR